MNKITWDKITTIMIDYNNKHNISSKDTCDEDIDRIRGVVVFTEDSFDKPYPIEARSYEFDNSNKAFIPTNIGYSIFANSLDGKDLGVRIDKYISGEWEQWNVDYCYLID